MKQCKRGWQKNAADKTKAGGAHRKSANGESLRALDGDVDGECGVNERAHDERSPEAHEGEQEDEQTDGVLDTNTALLANACGVLNLGTAPALHYKYLGVDVLQFHPMVEGEWAVRPHPVQDATHLVQEGCYQVARWREKNNKDINYTL